MRFLNLYIQNKPPSPIPNELKVKGTNQKILRDQNKKNQMTKKRRETL
jgi:hypothetical protein